MNRTQTRLLAAGFVLSLVATATGWTLYFRERQQVDALTSQVSTLEQEAAQFQPFKEDAKISRANFDMRQIERSSKVYYLKHAQWPTYVEELTPYLDQGQNALIDPWGHFYVLRVEAYEDSDGAVKERPIVYSQPPGGKPRTRWPEK